MQCIVDWRQHTTFAFGKICFFVESIMGQHPNVQFGTFVGASWGSGGILTCNEALLLGRLGGICCISDSETLGDAGILSDLAL